MRCSIVTLVAAVVGAVACTHAQAVLLSITPSTQSMRVDSTAIVRIRAGEVQHLHAYSFQVSYDPQILRCTRVRNLNFFLTQTFFFMQIDSLIGKIQIDEAILGPGGKSGSGDFAELAFKGLRNGSAILTLGNVDMRDTTNTAVVTTQQGAILQVGSAAGVSGEETISRSTQLLQNYPNPFNPSTTIAYQVQVTCNVTLEVYNMLGQKVATLLQQVQEAGSYQVKWNGEDMNQQTAPSGVYFYRIHAGDFTNVKRMMLSK